MSQSDASEMVLPRQFLRMCRANMRRSKVADSMGADLTGGDMLTRALIFRRLLRREVLAEDEQFVGVLLPPTVPAVLANIGLTLAGRVAVNLNYTVSSEVMNDCIAQCGIRHVLTSRKAMKKLDLNIDAELVCLEDVREKLTLLDKVIGTFQARLVPASLLERRFGLDQIKPDDVLTVIFTSGSTGRPKGVVLTYDNVGSNLKAFNDYIDLRADDVMAGILPLFHSFGYTVTMWLALALEPKVAYHFDPRGARAVGKLCREHGATILIATATFLRMYLRRCTAEDFHALDVVIAGAEKLPRELMAAFEKKFDVRPVEGYGTTELSPVVSCNLPADRTKSGRTDQLREGSVGRPLPGIAAKIVDPETGEDLGVDKSGMLLIKGPNVMQGYLGRADLTAEVLHDGWYTTGDIGMIDADGFIHITGRQSRFSKIGGEMVPHIRVEEAMVEALAMDEEELHLCVAGVPDPKKGERLVVLHTGLSQTPEEVCRALADAGLPPIWIPSRDSFRQIDEIPVLGTGKLDLRAMKDLAREMFDS